MLNNKGILLTLLFLLISISTISHAKPPSIEKQAVLAALTLNVARFSRWPENTSIHTNTPLNLCIFGDNIVQQSFENINSKVINKRTIHIINISRLRNLERCQLLYLSNLEQNRLILLLNEIKGQAILTIGENMAFLQAGGMIGLEKINGKIQLTVNLSVVKQSKLVISSRLLKLAHLVNFPIIVN